MRDNRADSLSRVKIKSLRELKDIIARLKARKKKIVFANGCFDLLHYGHVRYLEDARKKGDILVVAVNSDSSIKRIKDSRRPILNQRDRLGLIASLASVDYVTLFNEDTPINVIRTIKPDVLVKGADWRKVKIVGADFVSRYGGKVATVKLILGRSTTGTIKKIVQKFSHKN